MKKPVALLSLLLLLASCQDSVPSYDKLSDAEKQEALRRANDKCGTENLKDFTEYAARSNNYLAGFARGDLWKLESKSGTTTTTTNLYVWGRTTAATYFLYKYKEDTSDKYRFIKMSTAVNAAMIDYLRTQKCVSVTNRKITGPSSTISIAFVKAQSKEANILSETDTTYSSSENHPAFFSLYNKKVVTRKYKTDNTTLDKTDTVEYKFGDVVNQDEDLEVNFRTYNSVNTSYCIVSTDGKTPASFTLPFTLTCQSSPEANVNTTGTAVYDFFPTELGTY